MAVMMQLGSYVFSTSTARYKQLNRVREWRYATHQHLGGQDSQKFTSRAADQINLVGDIFPHYRGGLGQIDAMANEADQRRPLIMVDAYGYIHGQFVIKRISEGLLKLTHDGVPRKMQFDLQLSSVPDRQREQFQLAGYDPVAANNFTA